VTERLTKFQRWTISYMVYLSKRNCIPRYTAMNMLTYLSYLLHPHDSIFTSVVCISLLHWGTVKFEWCSWWTFPTPNILDDIIPVLRTRRLAVHENIPDSTASPGTALLCSREPHPTGAGRVSGCLPVSAECSAIGLRRYISKVVERVQGRAKATNIAGK
jgi:hypothetical protein